MSPSAALAHALFQKYSDKLSLTPRSGTPLFSRVPIKHTFLNSRMSQLFTLEELQETIGIEGLTKLSSPLFLNDVIQELVLIMQQQAAEKQAASNMDYSDIMLSSDFNFPLSDCRVLINVMDVHKSALYVESTDTVYPVNWNWLQPRLLKLLGKDAYHDYIATHSHDVKLAYDPKQPKRYHEAGLPCWNRYDPPSWVKGFDPSEKRKPPRALIAFMKHLFPEAKAREHVYRWLAAATFARAKSILVLCGAPGIGKNILIETVAAALVGSNNYRCSTRRFEAKFHAGVSNSRLYFLDEVALEGNIKEDLKQYHNGFAVLERKGKDAEVQEEIHASFVVANNYVSSIKLNESDRKFTVPEMTDTPLKEFWSREEIIAFCDSMQDDETLRDIAALLYQRIGVDPYFDETHQEELFRTICNATRPEWFQGVIHLCQTQEIVTNRDIRTVNDNRRVSFTKLADKVKEYAKETGIQLGELETGQRGSYTLRSKVFNPEAVKNSLSNEEAYDY